MKKIRLIQLDYINKAGKPTTRYYLGSAKAIDRRVLELRGYEKQIFELPTEWAKDAGLRGMRILKLE